MSSAKPSTRFPNARWRPNGDELRSGLPGPALGLRWLALAVVAGSGAFLPGELPSRVALTVGILVGAALGFAQYGAHRARLRIPDTLFILAQVAVWTFLLNQAGGQRSPLLVGLLLEIPLSGAVSGRRGALIAGAAAAAACMIMAALHPPLDLPATALTVGFFAVTTLLTRVLIDVLERQQREIDASHAALNARAENLAEELRLLGDYLSGALLALDDLGRVTSINPAGRDLLGLAPGDALGRAWQDVLRPDAEGARAVTKTLAEGVAQRGLRIMLEGAHGRPIAVEAELWVGPSAQGRRTYVLLDPDRGDDAASDPLRRLGEAVACVSHQIKNSLHALQGFARGIEREVGESETPSTRQLMKALGSLGDLASDVLAMSGARCADEQIEVGEILSSAIVLARHPNVRVQVRAPSEDVFVHAHRGQLVHALFNLIDNACQVSPPGGTVEVSWQLDADRVRVEIMDLGPGVPVDVLRASGRAPSGRGSGYGLLAARRFLEINGGKLAFEPMPAVGTLCRVSLPGPRPA